MYFTAEANRLLARYDPATNQIDWLMGTGQAGTHMVLANRDGSQLYTTNIGSGNVTVFDRVQGPAGWNLTVVPVGQGPEGLDLSPDGKELWVAHSRDGGVSVIDVASKRVTQTFDAGTKRSNRLKFTPDGKRVFISDLDAGELLVIERANPKEVKRIALGRMVEGILMAPGGSRAYVAVAGDNHVAVIDLASLQVTARIETGAAPDGMAWVPAR